MIFLRLLLAPVIGALFVLGYAPFNLWFMSLLSVLALLFLLNKQTGRDGFFIGWIFGLGMMGAGVSWVYNSMHIYGGLSMELASTITALFCTMMAFFYALVGGIYCALASKKRSMFKYFKIPILVQILVFASVWTLAELGRTYFWVGFPWLLLGNSLIDTPLAHLAPVGGVFTVSFLTAVSVAAFSHILLLLPIIYVRREQYKTFFLLLLCLLPWGTGFALQHHQWTSPDYAPLSVLLVQANTPQETKWKADQKETIAYKYRAMSLQHTDKDLIVWPEAALPYLYPEGAGYYEDFDQTLRRTNTSIIFGSLYRRYHDDGSHIYNGLFTAGSGSDEILPVYFKQTLVPMGEYIPFQSFLGQLGPFLGFLDFLGLGTHPITPGERNQGAFTSGSWLVAPSICYEITHPQRIASITKDSHFMLTVSNDSWFSDSLGPHQHFQIARMRALENQRYLIRSTNNGITAVIDARGKPVAALPQFEAHTLTAKIYPHRGNTPYQLVGDAPVFSLSLLFLLFGIYTYRLKTQLV